jgi:acyl carrier protein
VDEVRRIVAAALLDAGDEAPFADGDSLVASGRLASLDVVGILVAVETAFGVEVDPDEFDPMLFDSVASIEAWLAGHPALRP